MSNVVGAVKGHLRSRSLQKRNRSSMDPSNFDGPLMRGRAQTLRQRALSDEGEDLVVSSPKDKKFCSVPWEDLREQEHPDFFTPSATPVSDGPKTPTSAQYASDFVHFHNRHTFEEPRPAPVPARELVKGHRRTLSTPVVASDSTSSAGRRPSSLLKRRPMPVSKSEPSPSTGAFPTINELYDSVSNPPAEQPINQTSEKQLPPSPRPQSQDESPPRKSSHRPSRSVDVPMYHPPRKDSLPKDRKPEAHLEKPTYIELPHRIDLPPELHIHTPEYTNALKQWFPAVAQKEMHLSRDKKNASCITVARDVGMCH